MLQAADPEPLPEPKEPKHIATTEAVVALRQIIKDLRLSEVAIAQSEKTSKAAAPNADPEAEAQPGVELALEADPEAAIEIPSLTALALVKSFKIGTKKEVGRLLQSLLEHEWIGARKKAMADKITVKELADLCDHVRIA
eukprot:SAG11_NODE_2610_length_3173_cov_2.271308_2_plen_140_part_00